MGYLTAVSGRV